MPECPCGGPVSSPRRHAPRQGRAGGADRLRRELADRGRGTPRGRGAGWPARARAATGAGVGRAARTTSDVGAGRGRPAGRRARLDESLYAAGPETALDLVRELPDDDRMRRGDRAQPDHGLPRPAARRRRRATRRPATRWPPASRPARSRCFEVDGAWTDLGWRRRGVARPSTSAGADRSRARPPHAARRGAA